MKLNIQPTPLEARMERIAAGYRGIEDKRTPFVFKEEKLLPDDLVTRLQRGSNAFTKVRNLAAELDLAIQERDLMVPGLRRLCAEAIVVAKRHYGSDATKMSTFGVQKPAAAATTPTRASPKVPRTKAKAKRCEPEVIDQVVTTVVEEVTMVSEAVPCSTPEPYCGRERRPRPCRERKVPRRGGKNPCAAEKGCGSKVSRGR